MRDGTWNWHRELQYEYARVHTVMKSHEKSWNLKMYFPGLEKSWILRKMAEVMEKSWNFIFWSKDFMLFENWKNSPGHRAKICPQKAGFSAFLSHEKFKLVMKSHGKVIEFYCPISVWTLLMHNYCFWLHAWPVLFATYLQSLLEKKTDFWFKYTQSPAKTF